MTDKKNTPAPKHIEQGKQRWFAMNLKLILPLLDVFTVNRDSGRYPEFSHMGKFENGREELFDSMMRHVAESQADPLSKDKTGTYHLANVAANALMRLHDAMLETPAEEENCVQGRFFTSVHEMFEAASKRESVEPTTNWNSWVCSNCNVRNTNESVYTCARCGHKRG